MIDATGWRDKHTKHFSTEIALLQDQRVLDFLDLSLPTWLYTKDTFFINTFNSVDIAEAKQSLIVINVSTNINDLTFLLSSAELQKHPVCLVINKFLLFTNEKNPSINDNYDMALLEYIELLFPNRTIDYSFIPEEDGKQFNFVSPTSQFFIT